MNFILFLSLLLCSTTLEDKIKLLNPSVSKDTSDLVVEVLTANLAELGLDEDLVLATIAKESNFQRTYSAGSSGEWGLLQVIPGDGHIQKAALKYRCTSDEEKKVAVESGSSYRLCRCAIETNICNLPNIGYFDGNKYKVVPGKLALFFKNSPRAGLFVGLHELKYWKHKYDTTLKTRYWDTFPSWLFPTDEREFYRRWWVTTKAELKEHVWIVHHNYGGIIKTSHIARWYPRMIHKTLSKLGSSNETK